MKYIFLCLMSYVSFSSVNKMLLCFSQWNGYIMGSTQPKLSSFFSIMGFKVPNIGKHISFKNRIMYQ